MKCCIHYHGTKTHDIVWKSYAKKVNLAYPCYNIKTSADFKSDAKKAGMSDKEYEKMMGYKFKIVCDKCKSKWYKFKVSDWTRKQHEKGNYRCGKCGGNKFTITEIKN